MREGKRRVEGMFEAIIKLSLKHYECLELYRGNSKRLVGKLETSDKDTFTYGARDRVASVRISTLTIHNRKGYIEDRSSASSLVPYLACAMVLVATILEGS